jgi:hypothetical protein
MPKRIAESSLPVNTPWSFMISYFINAAISTDLHGSAINVSGSSQNTSTRVDVIPSFSGLSHPLLASYHSAALPISYLQLNPGSTTPAPMLRTRSSWWLI